MMVPIFTSIPPSLSRLNHLDENFGEAYQTTVLKSWIKAGCKVYSLNSEKEKLPASIEHLVQKIPIKRDASANVGKPLLYLSDMLKAIEETVKRGPFILTNADILFRGADFPRNVISMLKPRHCIIERRYDFEKTNVSTAAIPYPDGYDIFAFNAEDISVIDAKEFIFGIPWWDHWIPLAALFKGFKTVTIRRPIGFHLKHTERWDEQSWLKYGELFLQNLRDESQNAQDIHAFMTKFEESNNSQLNATKRLRSLSHHNLMTIDQWRRLSG